MSRFYPRHSFSTWGRWLTLGLGVKRWLLMLGLGALIAGSGGAAGLIALGGAPGMPAWFYELLALQFLPIGWRILLPLAAGAAIMLAAIQRLGTTLTAPFRSPGRPLVETLANYSARSRGPAMVAIGGGTGLPALLRGLKGHTANISAIVTVADDGGSSGRLRQELGLLPPGDFRNNIAALAEDEALMSQLLQYRFGANPGGNGDRPAESSLAGHAFGNLLLAALAGVAGSFDEGLAAAGRVLAMRGRVLPSTLANITLVGEVKLTEESPPRRVVGESAIPKAGGRVQWVVLEPAEPPAYPPSVQAILRADVILIGPGSLYTSILPNLLVPGIGRALGRSRALRIYVCNLATQPGETDDYSVADHFRAISQHLGRQLPAGHVWADMVLANDNLAVPSGAGGGHTVYVRPEAPDGVRLVTADLVDEARPWRHDSVKLARAVMAIVARWPESG